MRIDLLLPTLIFVTALPATAAYTWYRTTRDPTLRPLAVTRSDLATRPGATQTDAITIRIDWGSGIDPSRSRQEVERLISRSFTALAADHHFVWTETPENDLRITYVVGSNRFGPYLLTEAASGVRAAVAALRLSRSTSPG